MIAIEEQFLTTREVGDLLRMTPQRVRDLIDAGRLEAINTSAGKKRPRWLVSREALTEFTKPANRRPQKPAPRHRAGRIDSHVAKVF